jgi:hypothetical protein
METSGRNQSRALSAALLDQQVALLELRAWMLEPAQRARLEPTAGG